MRIMLVSEQPTSEFVYGKGDSFNLNIDKCEGQEGCWGCIKPKNKIPCSLSKNHEIDEKNHGHFIKTMKIIFQQLKSQQIIYYWTHYIKCPGQFRKEKDVDFDIKWLEDVPPTVEIL